MARSRAMRSGYIILCLAISSGVGCFAPSGGMPIYSTQHWPSRHPTQVNDEVQAVLAQRLGKVYPPGFDPRTSPFEQALLPAMTIQEEFARLASEEVTLPIAQHVEEPETSNRPDDGFRRSPNKSVELVDVAPAPRQSEPSGPKAWLGVPAGSTEVISRGSSPSGDRIIATSSDWVNASVRK